MEEWVHPIAAAVNNIFGQLFSQAKPAPRRAPSLFCFMLL
jgi:hypothetical protein